MTIQDEHFYMKKLICLLIFNINKYSESKIINIEKNKMV